MSFDKSNFNFSVSSTRPEKIGLIPPSWPLGYLQAAGQLQANCRIICLNKMMTSALSSDLYLLTIIPLLNFLYKWSGIITLQIVIQDIKYGVIIKQYSIIIFLGGLPDWLIDRQTYGWTEGRINQQTDQQSNWLTNRLREDQKKYGSFQLYAEDEKKKRQTGAALCQAKLSLK